MSQTQTHIFQYALGDRVRILSGAGKRHGIVVNQMCVWNEDGTRTPWVRVHFGKHQQAWWFAETELAPLEEPSP